MCGVRVFNSEWLVLHCMGAIRSLVSTGMKVEVNEQEESIYIESSTSSMCSCWPKYIYTYIASKCMQDYR